MTTLRVIDAISDRVGGAVAWLLLPLTGVLVYAVIMRYAFNAPVLWAHETSLFMYSTIGLLAGAYTLLHKGHVKVDVLLSRFSPRKQALLDVITALLFFIPFCSLVGWFGLEFALRSLATGELWRSVWAPVVWPAKIVIPIAALLLILQAVAKLIRDLHFAIHGRELP